MTFSDLGKSELVDLLNNRPGDWNKKKQEWNKEIEKGSDHLDLSGISFEKKALEGVDLKHVDLSGCNFTGTTLNHVSLYGSNLCGADFKHAVLCCVDFTNAVGLQESMLACAEMEGCQLPEGFELEGPAIVMENAKGTRTVFFVLLVGLLTCLSTLLGLEDFDIVSDKGKATLPFSTALVPVDGFLCLGPTIILVVFLYFCISLMNLRTNLSALPSKFPSGKTRNERCSHWILSFLAFAPLQPPASERIPFPRLIRFAAYLCEFVMVPFGLFFVWLWALKRHDLVLSLYHLFLAFLSVATAWTFGRKARKLPGRVKLDKRITLISTIMLFVVFAVMSFFSYSIFNFRIFENRGDSQRDTSFFDVNVYKKKFSEISSETSGDKVDPETERNVIEAQLEGRNFNFAKADHGFFFKAKLKGAQFKFCQLTYANLKAADLTGANFRKADLFEADLRDTILVGADLRGAQLVETKLGGSEFTNANLQNANLKNQCLQDLEMNGAKFQGAHLEGADFKGAKIQGADFQGAYLSGAKFVSAHAKAAKFQNRDLIGSDFTQADLRSANFNEADLSQAIFIKARLRGAAFKGAFLVETQFDQAPLEEAKMEKAKLWRANLTGALLWNANFEGAELVEANLSGIRHWKSAFWKGANIFGVKSAPAGFREWALDQGAVEIEMYIHDFN